MNTKNLKRAAEINEQTNAITEARGLILKVMDQDNHDATSPELFDLMESSSQRI